VPHEYLSEDQTLRYRRFVDDPSPGELELFFRMDAATVEHVKSKRRSHNRLGWSVQWGTIRMLGTFLSTPAEVPDVVTRTTGFGIPEGTGGLPGRWLLVVHRRATSPRCQRRIVAGVASRPIWRVRGSLRTSATISARSGQDIRGRATWRRSTASW